MEATVPVIPPHLHGVPAQNAVGKQKSKACCSDCWKAYYTWKQITQHPSQESPYLIIGIPHIKPSSTCPLCRFFWSMRWGREMDWRYSLIGFWYHHLIRGSIPSYQPNALLLAVVPYYLGSAINELSNVLQLSSGTGFIMPTIGKPWGENILVELDISGANALEISNELGPNLIDRKGPQAICGRLISQHEIDYQLLRSWLKVKTTDHKSKDRIIGEIPVNLIDIHDRYVVPASRELPEFIALSYVWGKSKILRKESRMIDGRQRLPDHCSHTIEDAIIVTAKLGFRYLWVDLYCVSKDPGIRHSQIAKMDLIYKAAHTTIIAVAGKNSEYGLPGVSRPRITQQNCQVGADCLVSSRLDILQYMEASKYSTRAWTYQERMFSERNLVFTDYQVFLQDAGSTFLETVFTPKVKNIAPISSLKDGHLQLDIQLFRDQTTFSMDGNISAAPRTLDFSIAYRGPSTLQVYQQHIQLYSRRNMSYDRDALNAIAAVLECFENEPIAVKNICGIPYQEIAFPDSQDLIGSFEDSFPVGLSWVHIKRESRIHVQTGFGVTTKFEHTIPRRRSGFPSW